MTDFIAHPDGGVAEKGAVSEQPQVVDIKAPEEATPEAAPEAAAAEGDNTAESAEDTAAGQPEGDEAMADEAEAKEPEGGEEADKAEAGESAE